MERTTHICSRLVRLNHFGRIPLILLFSKYLESISQAQCCGSHIHKIKWSSSSSDGKRTNAYMIFRLARYDHSGRDPLIWLLYNSLQASINKWQLLCKIGLLTFPPDLSDSTTLEEIHWSGCCARSCQQSVSEFPVFVALVMKFLALSIL